MPIEKVSDDIRATLFDVRRSIRYHTRRRLFFDRINKWSDAITAISGSGTIISILSNTGSLTPTTVLAAITAVTSVINLVFDTKGNARSHHDFARKFIQLEKELIKKNITETELESLIAQRLDIEAEEPPVLRVLDSMCHNELLKAMGYEKAEFLKISIIQSFLSPFIDFFPSQISKTSNAS
jgi:hypothetical protein